MVGRNWLCTIYR